MSNFSVLLQNTLHADHRTRADAETELTTLSTENFPLYMESLSIELKNEGNQSFIRSASGIALKNAISAKDIQTRQQCHAKWQAIEENIKDNIKRNALEALSTQDSKAGQAAAQFISAIAAYELPLGQWPDLMASLVSNISPNSSAELKQHSLQAIGYICESTDSSCLESQSNAILTAVMQGAIKTEESATVRLAALNALYDSLTFVRHNFSVDNERNYIMQVVCEATVCDDVNIQTAAYGCLVRIMNLYYDYMRFYMEKALFGLTIQGMQSENEKVALQAIEFWIAVCEEEIEILIETHEALQLDEKPERNSHHFAKTAVIEILPVLLQLLCKQSDEIDDDDWTVSMASALCIEMLAQCVDGNFIGPVLQFVEMNINSPDWKQRDAAVIAFGSILDGPDPNQLEEIVPQALVVLIPMMNDSVVQVKDSVAWTLGRISSFVMSAISPEMHLQSLVESLIRGLNDNPKIVANCCWALMNLSVGFGDSNANTTVMSPFTQNILANLLQITQQNHNEYNSRTSAYETMATIISNCAKDIVPLATQLLDVIISKVEETIIQKSQLLSIDEKMSHEELQSNQLNLLTSLIRCCGSSIALHSDRIMTDIVELFKISNAQSVIYEDAFVTVSEIVNALEDGFMKYIDAFMPFIRTAISKYDEHQLCSVAVSLVGDIGRNIGDKIVPYCDPLMQDLLNGLQSPILHRNVKPVILSCFGDLALAIGGNFEKYLALVMHLLQQACNVQLSPDLGYDMLDYVSNLQEGIIEAYTGIVQAFKDNSTVLIPYIQSIQAFLQVLHSDSGRAESLTRSALGLIGDLCESFPNGEIKDLLQDHWIESFLREGRTKIAYSEATKKVARWATEQHMRAQTKSESIISPNRSKS